MKVLITGANGFLGRAVVMAFLARGHHVRALVRPAADVKELWPEDVELVRADLRSPPPLQAFFDGVDALVHLAADVTGSDEEQFEATVVGTEHLLGAMACSRTKRLVLASSFTVYDWRTAREELDERTPLATNLDERGGYTVAKVWQERVARRMSQVHGFELTVLRPDFVWGRGNEWLAGLGQSLGRLHLVVAGTHLPLSYVENCADCFVTATESPAAADQTFNVVDEERIPPWRYVAEYMCRSGTSGIRIPFPYPLALGVASLAQLVAGWLFGPTAKLPSILIPARFEARFKPLRFPTGHLRQVLGWRPPYSFDEALDRTFRPEGPVLPSHRETQGSQMTLPQDDRVTDVD